MALGWEIGESDGSSWRLSPGGAVLCSWADVRYSHGSWPHQRDVASWDASILDEATGERCELGSFTSPGAARRACDEELIEQNGEIILSDVGAHDFGDPAEIAEALDEQPTLDEDWVQLREILLSAAGQTPGPAGEWDQILEIVGLVPADSPAGLLAIRVGLGGIVARGE